MGRTPTDDENELLASISADRLREGLSTTPADRKKTEFAVLSAYDAIDQCTGSHLFIWVDSPMAGVIASTFVGFALDEPLKPKLMAQLKKATAPNIATANNIRKEVDKTVWHKVRNAVHKQVAAELETRQANAQWQRMKEDIGNYTWDQVWQTIGDPLYSQGWDQQARESGGLFEENLEPWRRAVRAPRQDRRQRQPGDDGIPRRLARRLGRIT